MISEEAFQHYTLGIGDIDDEHWEILSLISNVCNLEEEDGQITMNKIITLWADHSNREEKLLEQIGYPYTKYHMLQHTEIVNKLEKMKETIGNLTYGCKFNATNLIRDICTHIDHQDLQVSSYINSLKKGKICQ